MSKEKAVRDSAVEMLEVVQEDRRVKEKKAPDPEEMVTVTAIKKGENDMEYLFEPEPDFQIRVLKSSCEKLKSKFNQNGDEELTFDMPRFRAEDCHLISPSEAP